ncbi:Pre-mRNA-splicing factor sap62 [Spathaspora sp. JA1]|nr:Pre-mRNA-splicing factor sap62 [Spathaspora sp. JA1]
MDYSGRVNSKKGAGSIISNEEEKVHRKKRVQELISQNILNLDNDPYVFRNHLGFLECKLCLTTHINESSYISHLTGQKHRLNLERRRILNDKLSSKPVPSTISISNIPKRNWKKIGKPQYKIIKIRQVDTDKLGLLITVKYPNIIVEPMFRIMSYYELTSKNQLMSQEFIEKIDSEQKGNDFQYLVISGEPYENIAIVIPNKQIDKPQEGMSENYWWFWDNDIKEFYIQIIFNQ